MLFLVTDDMLDASAATIRARYGGGLLQQVSYSLPFIPDQRNEQWRATIAGFKQSNHA